MYVVPLMCMTWGTYKNCTIFCSLNSLDALSCPFPSWLEKNRASIIAWDYFQVGLLGHVKDSFVWTVQRKPPNLRGGSKTVCKAYRAGLGDKVLSEPIHRLVIAEWRGVLIACFPHPKCITWNQGYAEVIQSVASWVLTQCSATWLTGYSSCPLWLWSRKFRVILSQVQAILRIGELWVTFAEKREAMVVCICGTGHLTLPLCTKNNNNPPAISSYCKNHLPHPLGASFSPLPCPLPNETISCFVFFLKSSPLFMS